MAATDAPAVIVRSAYKYYGSKKDPNKKIVLNHLNMTVEKGSIYGLLGSSGCGKTTLLSCVVGVRELASGTIQVLGGLAPGTFAARIGYMPQEVALVGEFSVKNAVYFFGRIYGLSESKIEERFTVLSELLELPDKNKLVKDLSGGQQRRVSFAAALVHEPELLILDEPTVGLDPMLRDKIWNFLVELAVKTNVAVIITTHYIEETKQAHKIGLMRGGELLAEEGPLSLMRRFNCQTLEDAFLILSIKQSKSDGTLEEPVIVESSADAQADSIVIDKPGNSTTPKNHYDSKDDFSKMYCGSTDVLTTTETDKNIKEMKPKSHKFKAIFLKNLQQFSRHPGGLFFSAFFPIIQLMAFFMSVGHDPRELNLGIVNDEVPLWSDCLNNTLPTAIYNPDDYSCTFEKLSCRYIRSLDEDIIVKTFYATKEEAFDAVEKGKVIGTLYLARNFSESFGERLAIGRDTSDETIENGIATYWLDMSNHQIAHFMKKQLYSDYMHYTEELMRDCRYPEKMSKIPIQFGDPIYGSKENTYTQFMAPGMMITVLFFLATTVTSNIMIADRLEGVWDRIVVAGVTSSEILTVHVVIQTIVILFQTIEIMLLTFVGYQIPFNGDLISIGILLFLQGVTGMCFGFFISIICSSYTLAFFISTGSFYPMILLCGIVWPLEGMEIGLRYIAYCLPFTVPIMALRNIIEKGYAFQNINVLGGYLVTMGWAVGLLGTCYLILKKRKS